jgi:hypothetical protein
MENKQGAVEWLIKTYQQTGKIDNFDLEVANEIFQEQIINAFVAGSWLPACRAINSEQYYKETYGK